jgi:hypothetical protein
MQVCIFAYDKTLTAEPITHAYCHVHQNAVDQCFHEFFPLNEQVDGSVTRYCPTSFANLRSPFMNVHSWLNALHIIAAVIWIGGIFVMATAAAWCAQAAGKMRQRRPLWRHLCAAGVVKSRRLR